ncbi:glycoside hydrolase family 16 protein, partial [Pseudonocardia sp. ICBG162]|uniref:glycoside hydrolase family 16 protein n=1 Tax=Pseudonocardia sp. ICBG162 TaxID=2846761 RepID=UPI0027DFFCD0
MERLRRARPRRQRPPDPGRNQRRRRAAHHHRLGERRRRRNGLVATQPAVRALGGLCPVPARGRVAAHPVPALADRGELARGRRGRLHGDLRRDRQKVEGFLHYGSDNSQTQGSVEIDATEWHAFAVEWTPDKITYLVDGKPWFTDDDKSHNPPGPMHLTIQLDYFGGDASGGAAMHVDWVRQYELTGGGDASVGGDVLGRAGRRRRRRRRPPRRLHRADSVPDSNVTPRATTV